MQPRLPLLRNFLFGTSLLASSAAAQVNSYPIEGPSTGAHAGQTVVSLGDVNGDGYGDFAVGAPRETVGASQPGRVRIYSGKTRSVLHSLTGEGDGDQFGRALSAAGDVDGDGSADLMVGAPYNDFMDVDAGRAYVFSGATGGVIRSFFGDYNGDHLGWSVGAGGDVDGDGHTDFVVGVPDYDYCTWSGGCLTSTGAVRVYSGATGLLAWNMVEDYRDFAHLGASVAIVGDTDLDGRAEILVGLPYTTNWNDDSSAGRVRLWDVVTDQWEHVMVGDSANALLGFAVAAAGDINGDGRADYAVAAPFRDGLRGRVEVYSGGDNVLYHTYDGPPGAMLGTSLANAGDLNLDGFDDLIVGLPLYTLIGSGTRGAARVYSGATGAILETFLGPTLESDFGVAVAGDVDVNGDGTPDMVVGADSVDEVGTNAGRTHVILMDDSAGTLVCLGDGSGTGCPCWNESPASEHAGCKNSLGLGAALRATGRASVADDEVQLEATHMPNSTCLFFQGTTQVANGAGAVFGDGLRCAGGTIVRLGTHQSAFNRSIFPMSNEQPVSVKGNVPAGTSRTYQVWYRNAAAFCSSATYNLTNAVRIDWRP